MQLQENGLHWGIARQQKHSVTKISHRLQKGLMKYYRWALSSISKGVTRLARAGRMTCKVRHDFKIITDELSYVSRQFHWWHRTFRDLRFVPQNLNIRKQVRRFWQSWSQLSKQARQRFQGPDPSYPVCYDRCVSIASSHPHRSHHQEEGRRRT